MLPHCYASSQFFAFIDFHLFVMRLQCVHKTTWQKSTLLETLQWLRQTLYLGLDFSPWFNHHCKVMIKPLDNNKMGQRPYTVLRYTLYNGLGFTFYNALPLQRSLTITGKSWLNHFMILFPTHIKPYSFFINFWIPVGSFLFKEWWVQKGRWIAAGGNGWIQ